MIQAGQKLWFVPSDGRCDPFEITVTKVGRKWAQTGQGYRINVDDLWADGGQFASPGRGWISQQQWAAEQNRRAAWDELRNLVDRARLPDDLAESTIRHAISLVSADHP